MSTPRQSLVHRPAIEPLEPRIAPATFVVLNLDDAGSGSLREAVADANAAAGNDKVVFQEGLAGRITLTSGQILISDDLVIRGPASGAIKISANDASRIFSINDGAAAESTVKLINLTLRDGSTGLNGGAVESSEILTVRNAVFRENLAASRGGAVFVSNADATLTVVNSRFVANSSGSEGGAIAVVGDLDLRNSLLLENSSGTRGGALAVSGATVEIKIVIAGALFRGNKVTVSTGGAIHFEDVESAIIRDSVISGNFTLGSGQDGGGIQLNSTFLTLTRTSIAGNTATGEGGGLSIGPDATAVVDASVVKRNHAGGSGGGIVSHGTLFVVSSRILNNDSDVSGGGIRTDTNATGGFAISDSLIKGNRAVSNGGGMHLFNAGDKLIDGCVITGNTAEISGGGIRVGNDTLTVIATTIAGNQAENGGGVSLFDNVTPLFARFTDCFITDNTASTKGGGIEEITANQQVLQNTPVTRNTAPVDPQRSGTFLIS